MLLKEAEEGQRKSKEGMKQGTMEPGRVREDEKGEEGRAAKGEKER
jgi:hypothetical protein